MAVVNNIDYLINGVGTRKWLISLYEMKNNSEKPTKKDIVKVERIVVMQMNGEKVKKEVKQQIVEKQTNEKKSESTFKFSYEGFKNINQENMNKSKSNFKFSIAAFN